MVNQSLLKYIKENLSSQASKDEIKKALLAVGWSQPQIDDGFKEINGFSESDDFQGLPESSQKPRANLKFIIIVLVFSALVGGGILAYIDYVYKETELLLNTASQINIQKNTNDQMANWQTYRNEEYGFEVKYPLAWKFGETDVSQNGDKKAIWFARDDLTSEAWVTDGRFGILPQGGMGFGLENLEPTTNEIIVGGLKAERTDYKTGTGAIFSLIKFLENKLPSSWLFDEQRFDLFFNSSENTNQFNQILSTFKFTK